MPRMCFMLLAWRRRLVAESRPASTTHTMTCKLLAQWTLFDTCSELCPFVRTFIATADKCCLVQRLERATFRQSCLSRPHQSLRLAHMIVRRPLTCLSADSFSTDGGLTGAPDPEQPSSSTHSLTDEVLSVGAILLLGISRSHVSDLIESRSCCSSLDQVSRGQRTPLGHFRI